MRGFMGDFGEYSMTVTTGVIEWIVRPGDSLSSISKEIFGDYSHVNEIAKANNIADPNVIKAGSALFIAVPKGHKYYNTNYGPEDEWPSSKPSIPYTQPITLPAEQPIPYTQPITLPAEPAPIPYYTPPIASPAPPAQAPAPQTPVKAGSGFDIWSYLPTASSSKIFGVDKTKLLVGGLAVLGLGLLAAARGKYASNPRRKRR